MGTEELIKTIVVAWWKGGIIKYRCIRRNYLQYSTMASAANPAVLFPSAASILSIISPPAAYICPNSQLQLSEQNQQQIQLRESATEVRQ